MLKLKYVVLALVPLMLSACQSQDIQNVRDYAVQTLHQQNPSKTLTAYTWYLETGHQKPLALSFHQDGRLSVSTTCNSLAGSWKVQTNELVVGSMMSTQMACMGNAMQQEDMAAQLLQDRAVPFVLNMSDVNQPMLTLHAKNGQRHIFKGVMTPETKYQGQATTLFFEIHPQKKTCTGVTTQSCLQVKEIKYNENGLKTHTDPNWSLFYAPIEGFTHSPNERQVIRVKRYDIKNPAADQSKYAYIYDMTIERGRL